MPLLKPFEHIAALSNRQETELDKGYDKYLTDRFFSYHVDTILYAAEAASFSKDIPKEFHKDFYFNSTKGRKRYSKWFKSEADENIKIISEYYDCSINHAADTLKILTEEQLQYIKEWYEETIIRKGD